MLLQVYELMPRCVSPDFCWALPSPCCWLSPVTWPMMFLAPATVRPIQSAVSLTCIPAICHDAS